MNRCKLTLKIRKDGITDENTKLFSEEYNIALEHTPYIIKLFVFERNIKVIPFYKQITSLGIEFSQYQCDAYYAYNKTNPKDSSSREFFKAKYGQHWERFFEDKCKKSSGSLDMFITKYGVMIGTKKYYTANKNKAVTLENFIRLYGDEEGNKKYNNFCEHNKGNFSIERFIELYGVEEGTLRHGSLLKKLKEKNTLPYYIELFGVDEGTERYNNRNLKNGETKKITSSFVSTSKSHYIFRQTMENLGLWIRNKDKTKIELYYREVWRITKQQELTSLKNFDKRGHQSKKDSYAIDHIISIKHGYENNIPPNIIGNIDNLQMLQHSINSSKCSSSYSVLGAKY